MTPNDIGTAAKAIFLIVGGLLLIAAVLLGGWLIIDYFTSDDKTALEDQLREKSVRIAKLESENQKYRIENRDLNSEVARLSSSLLDGGVVQEKRKALAEKEASLKSKESQLSRREERIHLAEEKVEKQQKEFYEKTGLKMEEIGAAKQIIEEYEDMRRSRDEAESRANNWLIYFSIVLFIFVVLVIASVTFLMYMAAKNRRVENSIRLLDSIDLSAQDKNLLISSLGGRLIEHPGKNDDEADKKEE